jgi:epoxyqueuosine reductase
VHLSVPDVKAEAARIGFVACGVTTLEPTPHAEQLDAWLAAGYAGTMRYLHRQARKRKEPALIVRGARRAVVVLDSYYHRDSDPAPGTAPARTEASAPGAASLRGAPSPRPRLARYARGTDYHLVTGSRLARLAEYLRQHGAEIARPYVDAGPVPERELAQRAGLGWIGKNTMLIRPDAGSFVFIGVILTDLELDPDRPFESDRCGRCTRCLEACPTGAFVAPRVLDATRCISYLTIEYEGEIPATLADRFQGWAFGCDICNEVCPWNVSFAAETTVPDYLPRGDLEQAGPSFFEELSEAEFERRFGDTALTRPGLAGMRRNWRVAFRSCADPGPGARESEESSSARVSR